MSRSGRDSDGYRRSSRDARWSGGEYRSSRSSRDEQPQKEWRSSSRTHRDDGHRDEPSSGRRGHHPSRSTSRSPSVSRKRRRQWRFDSPPKPVGGADGEATGRVSGFSSASVFSGGRDGVGTNSSLIAGTGLVDRSACELSQLAHTLNLSTEGAKAARELYIGNLPPGVDVNQLIEFLNAAILALKLNVMPGSPVVKSWISTDGHFAFVEFRTIEEASAGMQLNGLNCLGYNLRIGRPKTYPAELVAVTAQLEEKARLRMASSVIPSTTDTAGSSMNSSSAIASAAALAASVSGGVQGVNASSLPSKPEEAALAAQQVAAALALATSAVGLVTGTTSGLNERLVLLRIPYTLNAVRTRDLLSTFGALSFFDYVPDPRFRPSQTDEGIFIMEGEDDTLPVDPNKISSVYDYSAMCFFEFNDRSAVAECKAALHEKLFCDRTLIVSDAVAAIASDHIKNVFSNPNIAAALGGDIMRTPIATRVVALSNIAGPEELTDEGEYGEIYEDIRVECNDIAEVLSLEVPRPLRGFEFDEVDQSDVGFAFIQFKDVTAATKVKKSLGGRKYAGRVVEAFYFSEIKYNQKDLKSPRPNYLKEDSSLFNPSLVYQEPVPEEPAVDTNGIDDAAALEVYKDQM